MTSWIRLLLIVLTGLMCVFAINTSTYEKERTEIRDDGAFLKGGMGSNSHQGLNFFRVPVFPDSLKNSNSFSDTNCEGLNLFKMPIFIPDSTLTESMPILIPPPVDEGMIIPLN